MNQIKAAIYRLWLQYVWHFPIAKGKSAVSKKMYSLLGDTVFTIDRNKFLLAPISYIDDTILRTGVYDKDILDAINKALKNGGVYIDIGANFGYYAVIAAKIPGVEVFAFEPSPREYSRLKKNIELNHLKNIIASDIAASNENNTKTLYLSDQWNTSMNSFNKHFKTSDGFESPLQVDVVCKRLDEVIPAKKFSEIKLVKLDVEGFEYEVLQGMTKMLQSFNGIMICEITPGEINNNHGPDIYKLMESNNFIPLKGLSNEKQYDEIFYKSGLAIQEILH